MSRLVHNQKHSRRKGHQPVFPLRSSDRGQAIVLVALAMVAMLVATGLALDGGVLLLRKAQLDRAVDAAALTGVIKVDQSLQEADTRGQQLMAANGIATTSRAPDPGCSSVDWGTNDYCGQREDGQIPGSIRYTVQARWQTPVYFMQLVGFNTIPLYSTATAEYLPVVDLFASDTSSQGLVKTANQSVFGPARNKSFGDPFSDPGSPYFPEINGVYTYRIRIPGTYAFDKVRVEILDPDTGNPVVATQNLYGVDGTIATNISCHRADGTVNNNRADACVDVGRTPWTQGGTNPNRLWAYRLDENRNSGGYGVQDNTRTLFRLFYLEQQTDGALVERDLAYYIGKADQYTTVSQNSPSGAYNAADALNEAVATDLKWVSPGAPLSELMPAYNNSGGGSKKCLFEQLGDLAAFIGGGAIAPGTPSPAFCSSTREPLTIVENCGDAAFIAWMDGLTSGGSPIPMPHAASCAPSADHNFIIDLTSEVPNIFVDPNSGLRDIYLQVHSFAGGSENGYEFWAGPPRSADSSYDTYFTVPAQMNARQVYLQSANTMGGPKRIHDSNGISVYGLGHLPMNSDVEEEVDVPLAYLGPEFAGQQLSIDMFDPDSGAKDPIIFYFDTIPTSDWVVCFDDNDDGTSWSNCPDEGYTRQGPANVQSANGEWSAPFVFNIPSDGSGQPFYGGRLVARYHAGGQDTFGWRIVLESRPYLVR